MTDIQIPTSDIKSCAEDMKKEMLHFLKKIVAIESPSSDPFATRAVLYEMKYALSRLDYFTQIMPGKKHGGYLYARPKNKIPGKTVQLMLGHCDTVWPLHTINRMPIIESGEVIKGPGIFDMKAGITQIYFALRIIHQLNIQPAKTPVVLINSDEEVGSRESTSIIRRLAKISDRAYVLEPPMGSEGRIKTARKGIGRFTITVQGDPAHSGLDPGKGASAILELSHQIQKLFALNDIERGITVNVGMVDGGVQANMVAPTATAIVDVRVLTADDGKEITKHIQSLKPVNPLTSLTIEGGIGRPPMERTKRNIELWSSAKEMAGKMGIQLKEATAGGGSDGNTTSQFTATLDGLGTVGDGAHAVYEHIRTDKLIERTTLLCHLLLMP